MENSIISQEKYQSLFETMKKLISKVYANVSDLSIKKNLSLWLKNKKKLYDVLSKDPNWNDEELCLVLKTKVHRKLKLPLVREILGCLVKNHQICLDSKKYRIADALRGYLNTIDERLFDGFIKQEDIDNQKARFEQAVGRDYSDEEIIKLFEEHQYAHYSYANSCICYALILKHKIREGQKWSKVLNKIIKAEGLDVGKTDLFSLNNADEINGVRDYLNKNDSNWYIDYYYNYNQLFAVLSDILSPLEYDETIYISLNPIDYLTQSHGDNWNSCHSLRDKGCYHSATLTMMTDSSTLIAYTLSKEVDSDYSLYNKKTRQSLFIGENFNSIFQNSFYPSKDLQEAKAVREYLEEILSNENKLPNKWIKVNSIDDIEDDDYLGYCDWEAGQQFVCAHLKDSNKPYTIVIGSEAFTIDDPNSYIQCEKSLSVNLGKCADCGNEEDELTYLPYYDRSVCCCCLENDYVYCEDEGQYRLYEDAIYLEDKQYYVTLNCEHYYCEKCGCYYSEVVDSEEYGEKCEECYENLKGIKNETDY